MCGKSAYCWKTMFTGRRFAGTSVTSFPFSTMRPASGSSKPATIRSVVVLPHPLGPSSEKNSPSAISSDTSSTAFTPPKRLLTPSRAIASRCSSGIPASLFRSSEERCAELEGDRHDQVDVLRPRAPVHDRGAERDLPVVDGRAEVDAAVVEHGLAEAAVQLVELLLGNARRPVAEADDVQRH